MFNNTTNTHPNKETLEPGLLSVFRLIMTVVLVLQVITTLFISYAVWSGEIGTENKQIGSILLMTLIDPVGVAVFVCFLFSTALQQRLGRFFLPVSIALVAAGAIAQRYLFLYSISQQEIFILADGEDWRFTVEDSAWSLLLALLVPLVMVAWQYDFKRVIWFAAAVLLYEAPLIALFLPANLPSSLGARLLADGVAQDGVTRLILNAPGKIEALLFILLPRTLILLSVGYIVTRMIGAQRQQRSELATANDKLRQQAAMLEQLTISRERNRMARELHDTLAHSLSAVSVQLEAIDSTLESAPQDARKLLTKALAQTRSGLAETRRAMQSLRASPLDDLGLKFSLQTLAESTARRGGMKLDLQLEEVGELPSATEQNLYRIAQEALTNVLKHANASKLGVALHLQRPNGKVLLTISDNGVGFDPHASVPNGHFGLRGIAERADLIGATVELISREKEGTTIRLTT